MGISGPNKDYHYGCSGFGVVLHSLRENEENFLGKRLLFVDTQRVHDYLRDLTDNVGPNGETQDKALQQTLFTSGSKAMIVREYGKDMRMIFSRMHVFPKTDNQAIKIPFDKSLLVEPFDYFPFPQSKSKYIEQDGPKVYELMCGIIPNLIREDLEEAKQMPELEHADMSKLDLHQASGRVVVAIKKRVPGYDIPEDYNDGNPSSGSVLKAYKKDYEAGEIFNGSVRSFGVYGVGFLEVTGVVRFGLKSS